MPSLLKRAAGVERRIGGGSGSGGGGGGSSGSCCCYFWFVASLLQLVVILHLVAQLAIHNTEAQRRPLQQQQQQQARGAGTVGVVGTDGTAAAAAGAGAAGNAVGGGGGRGGSPVLAASAPLTPVTTALTAPAPVACVHAPGAVTSSAATATATATATTSASAGDPALPLEGVAVTLFLHSPTWFQRRNSIMVNLVRNNLPPRWKVQIFWMGHGQSKNAIDINPGVKRLIDNGDVILTRIPDDILEKKNKKKMIHLMTEEWLWGAMAAPKVLLFGGNSVVCTNSPYRFSDFAHYDYVGAPWDSFKGVGGEGAISIRSRDAMLRVLKYAYSKVPPAEADKAYLKWIPDDHFFVKTMLEMNKKGLATFKVADRNATLTFAATGSAANSRNLVVSGTLAALTNKEREVFMLTCPELKTLYPSLHEPACFGAAPNGEKCAKSICALEVPKRRGGC